MCEHNTYNNWNFFLIIYTKLILIKLWYFTILILCAAVPN